MRIEFLDINKENQVAVLMTLKKLQLEDDYITDDKLFKRYKMELGQDLLKEDELDAIHKFRRLLLWSLKNFKPAKNNYEGYIICEVQDNCKGDFSHYPITNIKLTEKGKEVLREMNLL